MRREFDPHVAHVIRRKPWKKKRGARSQGSTESRNQGIKKIRIEYER